MLTKQKEKAEISQNLKDEKAKLKALNEFLDKCNYISTKTKENSVKSQNFLRRFGEELDPILKKSHEIKNNVTLIDQALSNARSKYEYLQNARVLERRLSQKVQKSDLRIFMDSMDKALVIYEFTNNEKHTNESHAEINDKIEKALEFAIQQLTTLFSETVRDLLENNQKEDADTLMLIDQYLHKLGILDHFDTYVKLKERDFSKKIKEIISISDVEADEAYKKGTHPSINGVTIFINSLKQGRTEVNRIFSSGDANLIFNNLVNSYYKSFIDLTHVLLGPNNAFVSNYNFFASLDFVEKLIVNSEVLQTILGTTFSAIEDILDQFNIAFKMFIKNYSKIIMEENKKPENEQISHITYKAITLVTQLQEYHKVLSNLNIESEISGAIIKSVIKLLEENRSFFKPKNPIIPLIYILNNLFYMISKTKNEDTEAIIDFSSKDIMDELFEKHIAEYLAIIWKGSNEIFSSNVDIAHEKSGKLKSSTRKAVKKKFAEFNHLVQDFQKSHKDLWFINREFTDTLARKNKKHILAKYQSLFNTYGELNFTKNRDKYVKFTLSQLGEFIDETLKYSYSSANQK